MRDMMATHERLEAHSAETSPTESSHTLRNAAAAAFEALPAVLLAGALLMPALAALAAKTAERQPAPTPAAELGQAIASQGNQALLDIRAEQLQTLRENLTLPKLPS
jgi:hypothetical protein